jgi:lysozyme
MLRSDQYPNPNLAWPIPYQDVLDIAKDEGLELVAYKCPAGVLTIGYGETQGVYPGQRITQQQAENMLLNSLSERVARIKNKCTLPPTDNQMGAMVSFAYNCGEGALDKRILPLHNQGDDAAAARAFGLYNKCKNPKTGQLEENAGLTARRARETAKYLTPDPGSRQPDMPQAVAPETSLAASPIAQGSVATAATGALTLASTLSEQVQGVASQAKEVADLIGVHPGALIGGLLIVIAAITLYHRVQQRAGGWA